MQEDENKVDDMKGDVEEIRSWHADDTTNEHELKTLFSLSHNAWSSSPHEKNSRCEVWFSHTRRLQWISSAVNESNCNKKTDCNLKVALNAAGCPVLCSSFVVDSLTSFVSITQENEYLSYFGEV